MAFKGFLHRLAQGARAFRTRIVLRPVPAASRVIESQEYPLTD